MDNFVYKGSYIFKTGKHQGQSLEDSFFKETSLVIWLKNKRETLPKYLRQHLDFLLETSKKFEITMLCPICKKNKIKLFYLLPGRVISEKFTCCDSANCRQLMNERYDFIKVIPIKFESLGQLTKKNLIDRSGKLFKKFYGLPRVLKQDTVFNLFKSTSSPVPPVPKKKRSHRFIDGIQASLF